MGQRSKVEKLPADVKAELRRELEKRGFGDYEQLSEWLRGLGFTISKSAIHRWGKSLDEKLEAIRASTEACVLLAEAAPDDKDLRSAAVMSMVQTELFNVMVQLQPDGMEPEKKAKLLASVGKAVAPLANASIRQKKHELEIRSKVEAARKNIGAALEKGGTSDELRKLVEAELMGISR